jgi:hypothetical protein
MDKVIVVLSILGLLYIAGLFVYEDGYYTGWTTAYESDGMESEYYEKD